MKKNSRFFILSLFFILKVLSSHVYDLYSTKLSHRLPVITVNFLFSRCNLISIARSAIFCTDRELFYQFQLPIQPYSISFFFISRGIACLRTNTEAHVEKKKAIMVDSHVKVYSHMKSLTSSMNSLSNKRKEKLLSKLLYYDVIPPSVNDSFLACENYGQIIMSRSRRYLVVMLWSKAGCWH